MERLKETNYPDLYFFTVDEKTFVEEKNKFVLKKFSHSIFFCNFVGGIAAIG